MGIEGYIWTTIGVLVVAWLVDNIGGGGSSSSGEHTIGDFRDIVRKI